VGVRLLALAVELDPADERLVGVQTNTRLSLIVFSSSLVMKSPFLENWISRPTSCAGAIASRYALTTAWLATGLATAPPSLARGTGRPLPAAGFAAAMVL
jgi:hypothetical protein